MVLMKDLIASLTNGMFLAREPCVLVLFGMTAVDIGVGCTFGLFWLG